MNPEDLVEIAIEVDGEAAEAVVELFNRCNGGDWVEDSAAGEASGGGAVLESTGYDNLGNPVAGEYKTVVKTYLKPGPRGRRIQRKIEEGLWHLGLLYPMPEPVVRPVREEDWAHAWKRHYKPMRIGRRVLLTPAWEKPEPLPGDLVVRLEPGMAFGTGLHPTTRLCVAALEEYVQPGDSFLDIGTGSGVLSIVAAKLGAKPVWATDIDPLAVRAARENAQRNEIALSPEVLNIEQGSIPVGQPGRFQVIAANILAEVLVGLFDGTYGTVSLAEPLAQGGRLILSGILEEKSEMVLSAAARHGLQEVGRRQEADWVALVVRRENAD
ncbi:MAG: 50S ribosomal protein L11 methyltransferase [Caldilineaceae bacterium]|nr:50S ribosomal protein L11 methyltransferase [Caldilineaceae bacterium]MDE0339685.1 50S ribosomal protein L11 methyltransferase [Caldilineaceae bacterium]